MLSVFTKRFIKKAGVHNSQYCYYCWNLRHIDVELCTIGYSNGSEFYLDNGAT